jgi:hypothetical protein
VLQQRLDAIIKCLEVLFDIPDKGIKALVVFAVFGGGHVFDFEGNALHPEIKTLRVSILKLCTIDMINTAREKDESSSSAPILAMPS